MSASLEPCLIGSIGYVGFCADDPSAWAKFFEGAFDIGTHDRPDDGSVLLAIDDHDLRLAVHPGVNRRLLYVGWLVRRRGSLEVLATRLEQAGVDVTWFRDEDCAARRVRSGFRVVDPIGMPLEVVYAPTAGGPGRELGSHPTVALGHVVIGVEHPDILESFYTEILGFRVSDYIRVPWGHHTIDVTFLRVGDDKHHSLALQAGLGLGLEHFNLQLPTVDDVGVMWERSRQQGLPIVEDLGRHSVSSELSFYVMTPNGVMVEWGTGMAVVNDATWIPRQLTSAELWGHEVVLDPISAGHAPDDAASASELTSNQPVAVVD